MLNPYNQTPRTPPIRLHPSVTDAQFVLGVQGYELYLSKISNSSAIIAHILQQHQDSMRHMSMMLLQRLTKLRKKLRLLLLTLFFFDVLVIRLCCTKSEPVFNHNCDFSRVSLYPKQVRMITQATRNLKI